MNNQWQHHVNLSSNKQTKNRNMSDKCTTKSSNYQCRTFYIIKLIMRKSIS